MRHVLFVMVLLTAAFTSPSPAESQTTLGTHAGNVPTKVATGSKANGSLKGCKVLWVDSYDPEYPPIRARHDAANRILDPVGVEVRYVYMNTSEHQSEEFGKAAGLKAKAEIDKWNPDLVIASDDAASKYLVMPYYKDASLPIVFIGVNWDASPYGYPYSNATGQLEGEPIKALVDGLSTYTKGTRIALLTGDTLTDRRTVGYYKDKLGIKLCQEVYVDTFHAWKEQFQKLQALADMLILRNKGGIHGWDDAEAQAFVLKWTTVPTGAVLPQMAPYVLIGYTKVHEELGEYAARTALKILNGTPPAAIPVESNERAEILVNLRVAEKLGIVFKPSFLGKAKIVRGPTPVTSERKGP